MINDLKNSYINFANFLQIRKSKRICSPIVSFFLEIPTIFLLFLQWLQENLFVRIFSGLFRFSPIFFWILFWFLFYVRLHQNVTFTENLKIFEKKKRKFQGVFSDVSGFWAFSPISFPIFNSKIFPWEDCRKLYLF